MEKRLRLKGILLAVLASVFALAAFVIGMEAGIERPDFPEEVTGKRMGLILTFVLWLVAVSLAAWSFFSFSDARPGWPFTFWKGQVNIERLGCLVFAVIFLAFVALELAINYTHY